MVSGCSYKHRQHLLSPPGDSFTNISSRPGFNLHFPEPKHSALSEMEPGRGGQQRPEFARPVGQVEHARDAVEVEFGLLAGRPALQIQPGAVPDAGMEAAGLGQQAGPEPIPLGPGRRRQERPHAAPGSDGKVREGRPFEQPARAQQPKRGREEKGSESFPAL
jgi:hypothetical protein